MSSVQQLYMCCCCPVMGSLTAQWTLQPLAIEFLHVKSIEYAAFRQRVRRAYSRVWYVQNINAITFYVYTRLQKTDKSLFRPGAWRASALVERVTITAANLQRWLSLTLHRMYIDYYVYHVEYTVLKISSQQLLDACTFSGHHG
jgi:hypothetical protein